jgi:hypothetical protein
MTLNKAMTIGALGFAGFAVWHITRKPAGDVVTQSAQRARDAGLVGWFNTLTAQQTQIADAALGKYVDELKGMNIL